MKYLFQTLLLSTTVLLATSCSDNEETIDQNMGQVEFTMKGSNTTNSSGRVMSDLEITSATAAISKVEMESENDSIETETEFEGEYTVDLMTGVSDPEFGMSEVVAQSYNEIEIEFGNFLKDNASLIVEGTYTNDQGETTPFKYTSNKSIELKLEEESGITINAGQIKEIQAELDFSLLFDSIDFEFADENADGVVIIDASLNTYVYNLINQNFEASIKIEVEED